MKYLGFVCFFFLFFSCNLINNENIIVEKEIPSFSTLYIDGVFDFVLIPDTVNVLRIEATEKEAAGVEFELNDNILRIFSTTSFSWLQPQNTTTIYLQYKYLEAIEILKSCHLTNTDTLCGENLGIIYRTDLVESYLVLNYDTVYFWNTGSNGGMLNLKGRVQTAKFWSYGNVQIRAHELLCNKAIAENHSLGDIYVNPQYLLIYSLLNSGNVYCFQQPEIVVADSIHGEGKLFFVD